MRSEHIFHSSDGRTDIHVLLWVPEGKVRGVLQIAHGMDEFIERYDRFANALTERGYVVCGNDHLGHGRSVTDDDQLGFFREKDGNGAIIADMRKLHRIMKSRYKDVPYYLLGHSMGSFFARQYIETYGKDLSGVIIMGTGSQPQSTVRFGKMLCRMFGMTRGWHYRSTLLNNIALGSYNKEFEPARTPYDWLTRDEEIVDAYADNPLNTFCFTVNGYYSMFTAIGKAQDKKLMARIPKDLPVLIVSGERDPVGNFTKGVKQTAESLKKAGLNEVQLHFFADDRHEILNELDYAKVYEYIIDWLDEHLIYNME